MQPGVHMATILILDDDSYFHRMAATALSARGHLVRTALRCADADRLLAEMRADLILVDGLLPDGDGIGWIERLRERDATTPVLFVSSFWKNDARLRKLPVAGLMSKPIGPAALASKVENALRLAGATAELTPDALRQLEALRASYDRDLPGLLRGVREAVAQFRRNPHNAAVRGVARRRAHQVAGAAGSFGHTAVGDACAEIEEAIARHTDRAGDLTVWNQIDRALRVLDLDEPVRATG